MPSVSAKQKRFMQAAAHSPEFAAKVDVPQSVGREFNEADKRKARRKSISKAIDHSSKIGGQNERHSRRNTATSISAIRASAASSAPAQADVPVNQTPVDQPRPIGDQAPPKPEGQESNKQSHSSRREALPEAFARAKEEQEEAAKNIPKRAKPGMGHNQPPEAMAKEAAEARQGRAAVEKQQRYREGGKFARDPAKAQPEQQQLPLGEQPAQQRPQIKPLADNAPYRDAPKRWSEQTQQEWHATPESVRGAVYNMAREFQGAYQKYKADHDTMEELRPYHDLATKQGTIVRKAFDNYYGMELKLREDLVGGLDVIVQNVARSQGLTGPHGGPLTLRDVAQHVVNHDAGAAPANAAAQPSAVLRAAAWSGAAASRAAEPSSQSDTLPAEVHLYPLAGGSVCREPSTVR